MNKLKETEYVVYNKSRDVVMSREGEILIFDDECIFISCADLPQPWKDVIIKQKNKRKSK